MNLTSWLLRVKRARSNLFVAFSTSVLLLVTMMIIAAYGHDDDAQRLQLADGLAAGLAGVAVEPVQKRDRIRLGVLANRLADLPSVQGIAVYAADNQLLVLSGDIQRGVPATVPVVQDDGIVGYVRVYLVEADTAYTAYSPLTWWLSICAAVLIPLLVAGIKQVHWPERTRTTSEADNPPDEDGLEQPRGVLAVNLFNHLSLPTHLREDELRRAADLADAVAGLYYGRVAPLPGTGLILDFDFTGDPERPFQIVCAAFLLAQLLLDQQEEQEEQDEQQAHDEQDEQIQRGEHRPAQYRFGLHQLMLPRRGVLPLECGAVADATLLSAVARDQCISMSDELYQTIPHPHRIIAQRLTSPLLDQLESTPRRAWLATGLADAQRALIDQQARQLGYSADSTSRDSTF